MPVKKKFKGGINKKKTQNKMPTTTQESWLIEDIVDGPRIDIINGKKLVYYKVKWRFVFLKLNNFKVYFIFFC